MAEALAVCKGHLHGLYQSQGWGCQVCYAVWLRVRSFIEHVCHRFEPRTADRNPLQVWLISLIVCWWLSSNIVSVSVCMDLFEPSRLVTAVCLDEPCGLNPMLRALKSFAILRCFWVNGACIFVGKWSSWTACRWRWRHHNPLKRQDQLTLWHSFTPQKTWISYIGGVK